MKELTKKVVEAGLVPPQVVRLMKLWRCIPDDLHAVSVEELTQEELLNFVDQIAALLEESRELPEMRETDLDLERLMKTNPSSVFISDGVDTIEMVVSTTRTGQLVFPVGEDTRLQEVVCRRGTTLRKGDDLFRVTHVEPRYEGEKLKFYLCEVVPADA